MKIHKRKDNRFETKIRLPNGDRKSLYGKTKKELLEKVKQFEEENEKKEQNEKNEKNDSLKYEKWVQTWISEFVTDLKYSSLVHYKSVVKNHLIPVFGSKNIEDISRKEIQQWVNSLIPTHKPKTIRDLHSVLRRSLESAVDNELIADNPAHKIKLPKVRKQKGRSFTIEEIKQFFKTAENDPFRDVFEFLLLTGLRIGEVTGLTWEQYDRDKQIILIDRQLELKPEPHFSTPKHEVIRTVPLPDRAVKIIEKQYKEHGEIKKSPSSTSSIEDRLIFYVWERPISRYTLAHHFRKIVTKIESPDLSPHDLRHTYATLMVSSGVDVKTIQQVLGHSSASFTLDRYVDCTDIMLANVLNIITDVSESLFS